jgi:hypothetical protein
VIKLEAGEGVSWACRSAHGILDAGSVKRLASLRWLCAKSPGRSKKCSGIAHGLGCAVTLQIVISLRPFFELVQ